MASSSGSGIDIEFNRLINLVEAAERTSASGELLRQIVRTPEYLMGIKNIVRNWIGILNHNTSIDDLRRMGHPYSKKHGGPQMVEARLGVSGWRIHFRKHNDIFTKIIDMIRVGVIIKGKDNMDISLSMPDLKNLPSNDPVRVVMEGSEKMYGRIKVLQWVLQQKEVQAAILGYTNQLMRKHMQKG